MLSFKKLLHMLVAEATIKFETKTCFEARSHLKLEVKSPRGLEAQKCLTRSSSILSQEFETFPKSLFLGWTSPERIELVVF